MMGRSWLAKDKDRVKVLEVPADVLDITNTGRSSLLLPLKVATHLYK